MKITIVTIGSRGDVQPLVALGRGLLAAGHDVCINTHATFEQFVTSAGLGWAPLAGDTRAIMRSEQGQRILEARGNPIEFVRRLNEASTSLVQQIVADTMAALEGADLAIGAGLGYLNAYHAAEKLDVPILGAYLAPAHANSRYAMPLFPTLPWWNPLRGVYNTLSYRLWFSLLWLVAGPAGNRARVQVTGLPPARFNAMMGDYLRPPAHDALYGFSAAVLPRPPEWSRRLHITGYWFLDDGSWSPPPALERFVEAGPAPVGIGFGSMSDRDPASSGALAAQALALSGRRGVLLQGWEGLSVTAQQPNLLLIDEAPHDWLFPRLDVAVHHGGAGTTAAAFRAGVPQVIVPHSADQPFWAQRAHLLGVAPKPLARNGLTAESLARAIEAAGAPEPRRRAAALGEAIRAEDGVTQAVAAIERGAAHESIDRKRFTTTAQRTRR